MTVQAGAGPSYVQIFQAFGEDQTRLGLAAEAGLLDLSITPSVGVGLNVHGTMTSSYSVGGRPRRNARAALAQPLAGTCRLIAPEPSANPWRQRLWRRPGPSPSIARQRLHFPPSSARLRTPGGSFALPPPSF